MVCDAAAFELLLTLTYFFPIMSMHLCGCFNDRLLETQVSALALTVVSPSPWSQHVFQLWVPRPLSVHQFLLLHLSTFFFSP